MIEKIDLTDPKNKAFADMFLPFAKGAIQTLEKELKTEKMQKRKDKMNKNNQTKKLRNSIEWLENVLTVKTKIPGQTYTFYEVRPQLEEILKQLKELENLRDEANNLKTEIDRMKAFDLADNDGARDDW